MSCRATESILAAIGFALLCLHPAQAENVAAPPLSKGGLYDADPNHLWNRLHRALFVRTTADGTDYGFDQLDPLLWIHTTHLLEGPSHENAIKVLDEFLTRHGEDLVRDPLRRAILQRDLCAVFDWTAHGWAMDPARAKALRDLQPRLAAVIQRLALNKEQLDALPDNYADAARSGKFENDYDETKPETPFLPADLFSPDGPWVCVGLNGEERIAPTHVVATGGRSAFLVFMRMPGGRQEAIDYLRQFREFPRPYVYETNRFDTNSMVAVLSTNLPEFPNGTTFALVRQMILVDQNGDLFPTHLTESMQIRRYNDVNPKRGPYGRVSAKSQSMFEFLLNRRQLFGGMAGGLRAVTRDETEFRQFMDKGFDPFDMAEKKHGPISLWFHPALDCMECHGGRGVYSVSSFVQSFQRPTTALPQIASVDTREQRDAARNFKQTQFSWGLLHGLWELPNAATAGIHAAADMAAPKENPAADVQASRSSNAPDRTLLHIAARRGLTNEVELLIDQGADVNDKGANGLTPLADLAAGPGAAYDDQKYSQVAAILIAHGARVDAADAIGETPLVRAVEFGRIGLAQVLMEHGASLSATFTGTFSGLTPLFYAVKHGKKEMVSLILEFKPPMETFDPEGSTPLLWTVKKQKPEMARLLLEHGASLMLPTNLVSSGLSPTQLRFFDGNTPLHWALMRSDKEMIALLLEFKAPLDIVNSAGETPLDMVKRMDDPEINEIFRRAGVETASVPSRESIRAVARRITDGDAAAFDELATIADKLYSGIDYKKDRARMRLNSDRLNAAFSVLGEEAAKGNESAFQALKKSLASGHFKAFAPDALGVAAAGGHKESLEILLHHDDYGILVWQANRALEASAAANLQPAVDYFAAMLLNPQNAPQGFVGVAKEALESAAAKGNQKAKGALAQFAEQ